MTNLADFGAGIDEPDLECEPEPEPETQRVYNHGRCRALSMTENRRCRAGASSMGDDDTLCGVHERQDNVVTIDDDPVTLIEWTARKWFDDLGEHDVDADLIRAAVHNLVGLEDEPLPVYDEGMWLPVHYRQASRLIIRTPTKTVDSTLTGVERKAISAVVSPGDWDPDYLDGEGRTARIRNERCLPGEDGQPMVGLKIVGEEQRWLPVAVRPEASD